MDDRASVKECPECGSRVTWRNAGVRCLDCGREYCKECPDYSGGRFQVRCPDCGCREARPLENSGEDFERGRRPRPGRRMGRKRREGAPKPVQMNRPDRTSSGD